MLKATTRLHSKKRVDVTFDRNDMVTLLRESAQSRIAEKVGHPVGLSDIGINMSSEPIFAYYEAEDKS